MAGPPHVTPLAAQAARAEQWVARRNADPYDRNAREELAQVSN
jgi:hypothetical protein